MGLRLGVCGCALFATGDRLAAQAIEADTLWVEGVSMTVIVDQAGSAEVQVEYRLSGGRVPETVAVRLFEFLTASASELEVRDGEGAVLELRPAARPDPTARGQVTLPVSGSERRTVTVSYHSAGASGEDGFQLDVPVALLGATPAGSPEDMFVAEVQVPQGMTVWETFPVSTRRSRAQGPARVTRLSLPVIPSLVRLSGGPGPTPRWSIATVVDLVVGLFIAALSVLGLIWMRRLSTTEGA